MSRARGRRRPRHIGLRVAVVAVLVFLYFPLGHHFEQRFHVRHRLDRYGAGRCMEFEQSTPEAIGAAIADEIGREVAYRDVETDGAARAAALIAEVL